MPFAATWMDLEMIIRSEVNQRERQVPCDITSMWNLNKNDTNELVYKTETDSQTSKTNLWLLGTGDMQEMGRCRSKGTKLQSVHRMNMSRELHA